jgi:putative NADH-flavin reductase
MNVTVFGATGAIGSLTVDELLARGHTVTSYVRNPSKIPPRWGDRVRVVTGQITDAAAVADAVAGSDAVVSALGPVLDSSATGLPLVEGAQHIVESMRSHGVRRYIGHGTPAVLDERDQPTIVTRLIGFMGDHSGARAFAEMRGMTRRVIESDLDWTIIRFLAPRDTAPSGVLRVGFFGSTRIGFIVSRADIAAFTVAQLDDDTYIRALPAISNSTRRQRAQVARRRTGGGAA